MTTKTWARLVGGAVAELAVYPTHVVPEGDVAEPIEIAPGQTIPAIWTDDVSAVSGIAVGWLKNADGSFSPPPIDLAALRAGRATEIERACAAAITGNFTSAALGAPHVYGSKPADQANLDADMMAAASSAAATADIVCSAVGSAAWDPVAHTAVQIARVWGDFRAWRIACQAKKRALLAAIAAANDAPSIAAVAWSS